MVPPCRARSPFSSVQRGRGPGRTWVAGGSLLAGGFVLSALVAPLAAQCRPPANSNDAKLLAFYEAPVAFSFDQAPAPVATGSVRIALEVEPMPTPGAGIERAQYCYESAGENTRLTPVFARPRVVVGLPFGIVAEAGYVPPVRLDEATPDIGSLAVSRAFALPSAPGAGAFTIAVRAHGTFGEVKGPITCPSSALQTTDPTQPCYGTSASRDTYHPNMFGAEAALGFAAPGGRWAVYGGAGITRLMPRFQVGFTDLAGITDRTRVEIDLTRATVFGGITAHVSRAFALTAQVYSVPSDVTTARLALGYTLR